MCLVAFAINASARWPLVIASNRDEYFNRPALPMAPWQTAAGRTIISGRDLQAGGTWLGITPTGRMALLTNVRQIDANPAPLSRGALVMHWLENDMNAAQFMYQTDPLAYGGFNLVVGDFQSNSWNWLSNRSFKEDETTNTTAHRPQALGWCSRLLLPGVYGLSNAALNTPWPKTISLRTTLSTTMAHGRDDPNNTRFEANLWAALANTNPADKDALPDTGLPVALEQVLSSAFVDDPARGYGTRCSTLLLASTAENQNHWNVLIKEKTYVRHEANRPVFHDADPVVNHDVQWLRI